MPNSIQSILPDPEGAPEDSEYGQALNAFTEALLDDVRTGVVDQTSAAMFFNLLVEHPTEQVPLAYKDADWQSIPKMDVINGHVETIKTRYDEFGDVYARMNLYAFVTYVAIQDELKKAKAIKSDSVTVADSVQKLHPTRASIMEVLTIGYSKLMKLNMEQQLNSTVDNMFNIVFPNITIAQHALLSLLGEDPYIE